MRSIKSVYSVSYTLSLSIKYQSLFICLQDHREVTKKNKFQSFIISDNHYVVPPPPQKATFLKVFQIYAILFCNNMRHIFYFVLFICTHILLHPKNMTLYFHSFFSCHFFSNKNHKAQLGAFHYEQGNFASLQDLLCYVIYDCLIFQGPGIWESSATLQVATAGFIFAAWKW